jgi:hypothetical protein
MLIFIRPEELEEEFINSWKLGLITHPTIDYADNAIYGIFEGKLAIIFRFRDYGWINDNRYNSYRISSGSAGITIEIKQTKHE